MNNSVASGLILALLALGLGAGYLGGSTTTTAATVTFTNTSISTSTSTRPVTTTVNQTLTRTVTSELKSSTVNLLVIPDFGGGGYDAFVNAASFTGSAPQHATNTTAPGPNDNNITVSAGVPVRFVIANLDDAVLANFSGKATTSFSFLNNTDDGQTAVQYQAGQSIGNLAISHTFTISQLNLNIPIPPFTSITFTYTFTKPGVYQFFCQTPCAGGMTTPGYMSGYIIVS